MRQQLHSNKSQATLTPRSENRRKIQSDSNSFFNRIHLEHTMVRKSLDLFGSKVAKEEMGCTKLSFLSRKRINTKDKNERKKEAVQ